MKLVSLNLKNFRSYSSASFTFNRAVTVFLGPNASGKTNILEAIYFFAIGRSNRALRERDVVKNGAMFARIAGVFESLGGRKNLEVSIVRDELGSVRVRKVFMVQKVKKKQSEFLGNLFAIYFSPADIRLVLGSPSRRRSSLDVVLSQVDREYGRSLLLYGKVVKQKNKLLEKISEGLASRERLGFWNERLLESGSYIQKMRREFFSHANSNLKTLGPVLNSMDESLRFVYKDSVLNRGVLERKREEEIRRGVSLVGPHRDDFAFIKEESKDLASFGSRGEQRTAVFAFKMCNLNFLENRTGEKPILLLDDIFSELDAKHRKNVLKAIKGYQTAVTSAERSLIPKTLLKNATLIEL